MRHVRIASAGGGGVTHIIKCQSGYVMSGEGLFIANCCFNILTVCSCRFVSGFCWQHHFKPLFIGFVYRIILIDIGTLLYAAVIAPTGIVRELSVYT